MLTVGTDGASSRAALAAAERFPQVYAAIGRHPNSATGFDDDDLAELQALAAARAVRRDRRDRPGLLPRPHAAGGPAARVRGPDRARARDGQAARHPHPRGRRPDDRHARPPRPHGVDRDPALLLDARPPRRVPRPRLVRSRSPATSPTRRRRTSRTRRRSVPDDRILVETDAPYLTPQVVRKERNQPAFVTHTARFVAERRGTTYEELEATVERNAAALFGW